MTEADRHRIVRAIHALGVAETSRRLGLSTEATMRIALGVRVQRGTEALATSKLASLGAGDEA